MVREDYVSVETAKLLKEKGFDVSVRYYYQKIDDDITYNIGDFRNWNVHDMWYSMPTLQMAMRWLREVHNICIIIEPRAYNYINKKYSSYIASLWQGDNYYDNIKSKDHQTYEQACESAIKYCLKNLI